MSTIQLSKPDVTSYSSVSDEINLIWKIEGNDAEVRKLIPQYGYVDLIGVECGEDVANFMVDFLIFRGVAGAINTPECAGYEFHDEYFFDREFYMEDVAKSRKGFEDTPEIYAHYRVQNLYETFELWNNYRENLQRIQKELWAKIEQEQLANRRNYDDDWEIDEDDLDFYTFLDEEL